MPIASTHFVPNGGAVTIPERRLSESGVARESGEVLACKIARSTIRALQSMPSTLSGDDSALLTVWNEICVQLQGDESFYWESYVEIIETCVEERLQGLRRYELEALWLLTPEADEWECMEQGERDVYPVFEGDVVRYLVETRVFPSACDWSNASIRGYLDRQYDDGEY